ncbi:LysE family transporter (plasmid) [Roseomonas sp. CCTCC AB2023176]|uniref:LysE family transporter n=1 Tax=Roseomonas sp. CCTCC AB2023176 TaxID=3342640 RepID=UPI0035E02B94
MLAIFASAFLFGLAFNAAPGAVTAESRRRGLRGGFRPAFAVQFGFLVGDFGWALLGLAGAGAGALFSLPLLRVPLEIAGAGLLAWMAWGALRDGRAGGSFQLPKEETDRGALAAGAALSLSNPQNVTFWVALDAPMAALGVERPLSPEAATFFAGFGASSILWCFVAAGFIAWAGMILTPALHRGPTSAAPQHSPPSRSSLGSAPSAESWADAGSAPRHCSRAPLPSAPLRSGDP